MTHHLSKNKSPDSTPPELAALEFTACGAHTGAHGNLMLAIGESQGSPIGESQGATGR